MEQANKPLSGTLLRPVLRTLSLLKDGVLKHSVLTNRSSKTGLLALALICPMALLPVSKADQFDPSLNEQFQQLKQAQTSQESNGIMNGIWSSWLKAPDSNAETLLLQVTDAMSINRLDLALELCDQLVDTNPEFSEAWNKRATVHYLLGNHALSVADIKQTLLLEPRHFGALSGLGHIFMSAKKYEAAVDAFEAVLEISPSSENAQTSLARAKAQIGREI